MRLSQRDNSAFTLIELLIVITVIALILSIMIPALRKAKWQSQVIVCLANVRGISQAWHLYTIDNNEYMAGSFTDETDYLSGAPLLYNWVYSPRSENDQELQASKNPSTVEEKKNGLRKGVLYPYLQTEDVFHCPSDKRCKEPAIHPNAASGMTGAYRTYSIVSGLNSPFPFAHKKLTTVKNPSAKYALLEEADGRGYNVNSWHIGVVNGNWVDPIGIFHYDRGNLGFTDGHGEKHVWLDPDTIEMASQQTFGLSDPGSKDLEYMLIHYPKLD